MNHLVVYVKHAGGGFDGPKMRQCLKRCLEAWMLEPEAMHDRANESCSIKIVLHPPFPEDHLRHCDTSDSECMLLGVTRAPESSSPIQLLGYGKSAQAGAFHLPREGTPLMLLALMEWYVKDLLPSETPGNASASSSQSTSPRLCLMLPSSEATPVNSGPPTPLVDEPADETQASSSQPVTDMTPFADIVDLNEMQQELKAERAKWTSIGTEWEHLAPIPHVHASEALDELEIPPLPRPSLSAIVELYHKRTTQLAHDFVGDLLRQAEPMVVGHVSWLERPCVKWTTEEREAKEHEQ